MFCTMYMDILVPMTILLLGLSPTMCVQGDFRPLASSTRSSSDGTSMQNWVLPASDVPCNGLARAFRLNVENM